MHAFETSNIRENFDLISNGTVKSLKFGLGFEPVTFPSVLSPRSAGQNAADICAFATTLIKVVQVTDIYVFTHTYSEDIEWCIFEEIKLKLICFGKKSVK